MAQFPKWRFWRARDDDERWFLMVILSALALIIMAMTGLVFFSLSFTKLMTAVALGLAWAIGGSLIAILLWSAFGGSLFFLVLKVRKRKGETLFVSERYAEEIKSKTAPAYVILSIGILIAIFTKEYVTASIIGATSVALGSFYWLTDIRAERGWFADNRYEVLELLQFIIEKSESGGLPPGSRVSRHASEVVQLRTSPSEEIAGSHA